jgi:tetratricopeptide (TPR) repeat protein
MKWQSDLTFNTSCRVMLLSAPAGEERRRHATSWLEQARQRGYAVWLLPCDRRAMGPWAGLIELFGDLVPRLQTAAPHLLIKHDYELAIVMPTFERTTKVRNPTLTDVASEKERTRNYPMDRAYRIVHGLIDLLVEAQRVLGDPPYALACDDLDHGGALVRMFFTELVRRRGERTGLRLLIAAEPSATDALLTAFPTLEEGARREPTTAAGPPSPPEPLAMRQRAQELEKQAERDGFERQFLLPQIIHAWLHSDEPARALPYQIEAFAVYNTRGLYEDALFYGEPALRAVEQYTPDALMDRMNVCVKLYSSYVGLKRSQEAQRTVEYAMGHSDGPRLRGQWRYMNAMLHARFLPERDFERARQDLDLGMRELEESELNAHTKAFLMAFNRNGLALIHYQQGRADEAIALCKWGYEHLASQLDRDEQRLHRSVLVYNIAQVYNSAGRTEEAIHHFGEAMAADPNYSEYYNERGNIYLKLGRYEDALRDYLKAIELSPPYMEVWTNLGQCYKALDRMAEAIDSYGNAIDLDPRASLALIGRAQAYDAIGEGAAALADYDAVLAIDPRQPLALMNRAALHYEQGRPERALGDLDRAIEIAPEMADLYENRAVALRALGKAELAEGDDATAARLAAA